MSGVMTAIGIGWGITWFTYAADYSRFVSRDVPGASSTWPACSASSSRSSGSASSAPPWPRRTGRVDPGKLIVGNFGALAIPVLLLVIHGPIATNILNIYTFTVAAQALDIKVNRRKLSLVVGVFAMAAVMFFIFQGDLASTLDAWLIGIVAWIAAWGGIMLVHYYKFERGELEHRPVVRPARRSVGCRTSTGRPWPRSPWACSRPGCSSTD